MKFKVIFACLIIMLFIFGCTSPPTPEPYTKLDDSSSTPQMSQAIALANNDFAFKSFDVLKNLTPQFNIFFSPFSISSAMVMVYEGAKGSTADEIATVFGFSKNDTERRAGFARVFNELNSSSTDYQLKVANSIWVQKDFKLLPNYVSVLDNYYGGKASELDYSDPVKSSSEINAWVASKTNDKIKDLISPNNISPDTRLILVNAIYFKGKWSEEFKKEDTKKMNFFHSSDQVSQVDMMQATHTHAYAENDKYQALEMDYKGDKLSMVVILPKNDLDGATILSQTDYTSLVSGLQSQSVDVFFPKFTFKTKYDLTEPIKSMGINSAFDPSKADFSGITNSDKLYISFIIHQAFVSVDEEGTEAAAATAIGVVTTAMPREPVTFKADHPFYFFIRDKTNGNILFMGYVNEPTAD